MVTAAPRRRPSAAASMRRRPGQVVQLQQALAADAVRMLHRPVGIAGDHRFPVGEVQQFAIGAAWPALGDGGRQQVEVGCPVEGLNGPPGRWRRVAIARRMPPQPVQRQRLPPGGIAQ